MTLSQGTNVMGSALGGIEHNADQRLIGLINLSFPHPRNRRTELGFTIAQAYWRQGYASEAARGVIKFALGPMQLYRVEAVCLPENQASACGLQKAGMQYEGLLHSYQVWRGEPRDLQMYAVTALEYSKDVSCRDFT